MAKYISCPTCHFQYLPGEIFISNYLVGQPKRVIRNKIGEILGAGVGAGVLVSRYFGAQNYGKMKTIVSTSLISFLLLSIFLGVFGFCSSHWMMSVLQTPADIMDDAVLYLRIYFAGFLFLFMYNILSTMFTSIGESKIPLWLLIFSSIFLISLFIIINHFL